MNTHDIHRVMNTHDIHRVMNTYSDEEHLQGSQASPQSGYSIKHSDESLETDIHNRKMVNICQLCGKVLTKAAHLHQCMATRKHAAADKKWKCNFCGKELSHQNLIEHMRTHAGTKCYKCDICGRGFRKNYSLTIHKRKHTSDYECDVCGERCHSNFNLKQHMRKHTGEKPYKCDVCGKDFTRKCDLNMHSKEHANDKAKEK
jgi:KRAB domain-containing zinc finger protein